MVVLTVSGGGVWSLFRLGGGDGVSCGAEQTNYKLIINYNFEGKESLTNSISKVWGRAINIYLKNNSKWLVDITGTDRNLFDPLMVVAKRWRHRKHGWQWLA